MNFRTFDLNLLRVLDAMLREPNTTRVGERIGLSQPAVSAALARLRDQLGDPLFVREGNALVATPFARSLETPLRGALEGIEHALSGGGDFDPARSSRVFRIGGSDFFSEMLMPKLADTVFRLAPGMRLHLIPAEPAGIARDLAEGAADMALYTPESMPDWVDQAVALHSSAFAVARAEHPRLKRAGLKPGDTMPMEIFCDMPQVLFSPSGEPAGMEDRALAALGRSRKVVVTVPEFSGVGRIVAQSDLIGVLPSRFALSLAAALGLRILRLPFDMPFAQLRLYWHHRHTASREHRWMRDMVLQLLAPLDEAMHPIGVEELRPAA